MDCNLRREGWRDGQQLGEEWGGWPEIGVVRRMVEGWPAIGGGMGGMACNLVEG